MFPTSYELVVFIHVAVAFVLVGGSLSAPLLRGAIRAAGSPAEVRQWIGFARRATRLNPAAAFVVLATGVWLATSLLAVLVVNRTEKVLEDAANAGWSPEALDPIRFAAKWDVATASMLANDFALIWIMMQKPSTTASIGALAAANAILIGLALARRSGTARYGEKVGSEA